MAKEVFETVHIGGIEVKNRLIRSATQELMADDGRPTKRMFKLFEDLSKGEVGLIITGYFTFSDTDNPLPINASLAHDNAISELQKLTGMVHQNKTKIVAQLVHLGSQIRIQTNTAVYGPSDIPDPYGNIKPQALTKEQIEEIVSEFGQASLRAKEAGFDGVQIHGAHGYLLSKFLSPFYNQRDDEYGGSPEKNAQILLDVLVEIKRVCGAEFPVWIKLNCEDFGYENDSMNFSDALVAARLLENNGIDCIELSGGTSSGKLTPARSKQHEAYHFEYAKELCSKIDTPIIAVGGFRDIKTIEGALMNSGVEAISLCRPFIREPHLPKRWKGGDRSVAKCVACGACFNPKGIACIFNLEGEALKEQKTFLKQLRSASKPSKPNN